MNTTEENKARRVARKKARNAKREEEAAREAHNAAIPITVKPRRTIGVSGQQPVPDALKRAQKKQRKLKEQAARLASALKIPKKSRVIPTYTDEQAKARWRGQPTRIVITEAYPGYEPPMTPDVDIMSIAWQGGAPGLGKKS